MNVRQGRTAKVEGRKEILTESVIAEGVACAGEEDAESSRAGLVGKPLSHEP